MKIANRSFIDLVDLVSLGNKTHSQFISVEDNNDVYLTSTYSKSFNCTVKLNDYILQEKNLKLKNKELVNIEDLLTELPDNTIIELDLKRNKISNENLKNKTKSLIENLNNNSELPESIFNKYVSTLNCESSICHKFIFDYWKFFDFIKQLNSVKLSNIIKFNTSKEHLKCIIQNNDFQLDFVLKNNDENINGDFMYFIDKTKQMYFNKTDIYNIYKLLEKYNKTFSIQSNTTKQLTVLFNSHDIDSNVKSELFFNLDDIVVNVNNLTKTTDKSACPLS